MAPRLPPELLERIARFCEPEAGYLLRLTIGYDERRAFKDVIGDLNVQSATICTDSAVLMRAYDALYARTCFSNSALLEFALSRDLSTVAKYLAEKVGPVALSEQLSVEALGERCNFPCRTFISFYKERVEALRENWHEHVNNMKRADVETVLAAIPGLQLPRIELVAAACDPAVLQWAINLTPRNRAVVLEEVEPCNRGDVIARMLQARRPMHISTMAVVGMLPYSPLEVIRLYGRRHRFPLVDWTQVYSAAVLNPKIDGDVAISLHRRGVKCGPGFRAEVQERYKNAVPPDALVARHICSLYGVSYAGKFSVLHSPVAEYGWAFKDIKWLMEKFKMRMPQETFHEVIDRLGYEAISYLERRIA